jgi:hypothetical protein
LFAPKYIVSQTILNKMLEIERSRVIVDQLTLPAVILAELIKESGYEFFKRI